MWNNAQSVQSYGSPEEQRTETYTEMYSRKVFVGGLPIDM